MLKNRFSKKEKKLFIVTVSLTVFAFVYSFVIEPSFMRFKRLDQELKAKKITFLKNTKLLKMHNNLKKEYSKYKDKIENQGDQDMVFANALEMIEQISAQASCRIVSIKPFTPKRHDDHTLIFFDITVEAQMKDIGRLLYEIEKSSQGLNIANLTMTAKSNKDSAVRANLRLEKIIIGA